MTQEQKDLLLKDLSSRLPYGVKVQVDQQGLQKYDAYWNVWDLDKEAQEVSGIHRDGVSLDCMAMCDGVIPFEFIKPYLLPLSSMTEEQKEEYTFIVDYISPDDSETLAEGEFIYVDLITELMHFYNKYHLDYRGLIPKGLALDATNLNIY